MNAWNVWKNVDMTVTVKLPFFKILYLRFNLQIGFDHPSSENAFTDGLKINEGVTASTNIIIRKPPTCHLPDDSSVYIGELRASLLALLNVYHSQEISFLILIPYRLCLT